MAESSANCPICNKKAKQAAASAGDYTKIDCANCGRFQISRTVQAVIPNHPATVRRQSLERARIRARYGSLPMVTTYDLP